MFRAVEGIVLGKSIDSETCQARYFKGKVRLQELFVIFALLVVNGFINEAMNVFVIHWFDINSSDVAITRISGGIPAVT